MQRNHARSSVKTAANAGCYEKKLEVSKQTDSCLATGSRMKITCNRPAAVRQQVGHNLASGSALNIFELPHSLSYLLKGKPQTSCCHMLSPNEHYPLSQIQTSFWNALDDVWQSGRTTPWASRCGFPSACARPGQARWRLERCCNMTINNRNHEN